MGIEPAKSDLVDVDGLTRFLSSRVPDPSAPLSVEKHDAGYSNETFYVTGGAHRWVLRRPPRGDLLPTSHDVLREYRVISALAGTRARVPRTVIACADSEVIGAPFYLMERIDGVVIQETLPAALDTDADRRRIAEELVDALVELHSVEWRTTALSNAARPDGFLERQVRRWSGQLALTLPHTRALPGMDAATDWLRRHLPESDEPAVVHGDYKLDNVIFRAEPPARLLALLDWEMATVGDPLTDLG